MPVFLQWKIESPTRLPLISSLFFLPLLAFLRGGRARVTAEGRRSGVIIKSGVRRRCTLGARG